MGSFKYDNLINADEAQNQQINIESVEDLKAYADHAYEGLRYANNYEGVTTVQDVVDAIQDVVDKNQQFISPGVFVRENDISIVDRRPGMGLQYPAYTERSLVDKTYVDLAANTKWIQKKYTAEEFFNDNTFDDYYVELNWMSEYAKCHSVKK